MTFKLEGKVTKIFKKKYCCFYARVRISYIFYKDLPISQEDACLLEIGDIVRVNKFLTPFSKQYSLEKPILVKGEPQYMRLSIRGGSFE